jgi:hypothetical protein
MRDAHPRTCFACSALLYGVPVMAFIFLNPLYETFFSFG